MVLVINSLKGEKMKLYVGGLPFETTEEELQKLFEEYKPAETTLIKDKFSGRSKGFGFVTIDDDAQAKEAIDKLNGKEVGGRSITVNEARPKTDRFSRGGFGGGGGKGGGGPRKGNRW